MYIFVLSIHIILAVSLVGLVLLQQGKGADVGAIVTGGGANSLFGVGGASSLLVRMTTGIAIAFMLTSVLLVRFASQSPSSRGAGAAPTDAMSGSVFEEEAAKVAPITPTGAGTAAAVAVTPGAEATAAATPPPMIPAQSSAAAQ